MWLHDRKAGLVRAEGQEGYICRGFKPEHGNLLAAAPELLASLKEIVAALGDDFPEVMIADAKAAIAKAEGNAR